jgi:hypothetical protein
VVSTTASGNGLDGIEIATGLITGSTITSNGTVGSGNRGGIIFAANGGTVDVTNNLTPADIYCGRDPTILARRQTIKHKTIELRRRQHHQAIA